MLDDQQFRCAIEQVKSRISILEVVSRYSSVETKAGKHRSLCPSHSDTNPSLNIDVDRGIFKCFVCGFGGDALDYVQTVEGVGLKEALSMLAETCGVDIGLESDSNTRPKRELYKAVEQADLIFRSTIRKSPQAIAYLHGRGISDESIERFGLGLVRKGCLAGFDPDLMVEAGLMVRDEYGNCAERMIRRLTFPIRDWLGRTIAFGGRISPTAEYQGKKPAKFINSPFSDIFSKEKHVYGADLAKAACRKSGEVIAVEGYVDVLTLHQHGIENCVATLGTALNASTMSTLRRLAPKVVLALDGDEAGLNAAERSLGAFLAGSLEVSIVTLDRCDPDDFVRQHGPEAFLALPRVDPLEFASKRLLERHGKSPEGVRRAAEEFAAIISAIPQTGSLGIKLSRAVTDFSAKIGVESKVVQSLVKRQRPETTKEMSHDAIDLELLACIVNRPETAREAATVVVPRDPKLKPIIAACFTLSGGEAITLDSILSVLGGEEKAVVASLCGPGDWDARARAVIRASERRDASEMFDALRAELAICDEQSRGAVRAELSRATKRLIALDSTG